MIKGQRNGKVWQHCSFSLDIPIQRAFVSKIKRISTLPLRFQADYKSQSFLTGIEGLIKLVAEADSRGLSAGEIEAAVCDFIGMEFSSLAVDFIVAARLALTDIKLDDDGVVVDKQVISDAISAHTTAPLVASAPSSIQQAPVKEDVIIDPPQETLVTVDEKPEPEQVIKRDVKVGVKRDWKGKYSGTV